MDLLSAPRIPALTKIHKQQSVAATSGHGPNDSIWRRDLGELTRECELRGLDLEETPAPAAHGCFLARSLILGSLLFPATDRANQELGHKSDLKKMVLWLPTESNGGKPRSIRRPLIDGNEEGWNPQEMSEKMGNFGRSLPCRYSPGHKKVAREMRLEMGSCCVPAWMNWPYKWRLWPRLVAAVWVADWRWVSEGEGIDVNVAELGESVTWWFCGVRWWLPNVQVQVGTGICFTVLPSIAYASSFHFAVSFPSSNKSPDARVGSWWFFSTKVSSTLSNPGWKSDFDCISRRLQTNSRSLC